MDLWKLTQSELVELALRLLEENARLAAHLRVLTLRVQELETHLLELSKDKGGSDAPPAARKAPDWVKPNRDKSAEVVHKPRKKRAHNVGRRRDEPTQYVRHAVETCECGCRLGGGWVKRRRQVLHIPIVSAEVIEHEFVERQCPQCGRSCVPKGVLSGEVLAGHRVSIDTMAVIATLREVGRLPVRTIRWYLETFYQLKLSMGELVRILRTVAERGKALVERYKVALQASPVVHGDETGWRQDGRNGYVWTLSTPEVRYFVRRASRSGEVVTETLGGNFQGTLVSDFYAGYNRMSGQHQRCWVHLLRDVHELKEDHPEDNVVQRWARAVHRIYSWAKALRSDDPKRRVKAQRRFEQMLSKLCQPFLGSQAPPRTLCERIERYLPELFAFVANPEIPSDNNAAERSLRPLVVSRKISGGTRSEEGSDTKMTLATLYQTWLLRTLNPFEQAQALLRST